MNEQMCDVFCRLPCSCPRLGPLLFCFLCTGVTIYAIIHVYLPVRVKMADSVRVFCNTRDSNLYTFRIDCRSAGDHAVLYACIMEFDWGQEAEWSFPGIFSITIQSISFKPGTCHLTREWQVLFEFQAAIFNSKVVQVKNVISHFQTWGFQIFSAALRYLTYQLQT